MSKPERDARHHSEAETKIGDVRSPFQRDRDRILYTSAFRRLAEVTQVIAADDAHVFHNRLTHSLEVAQVGRGLAESLLRNQSDLVEELGGVDPDVVEAACRAHDLGHPPFGHIAEEELDQLGREAGLPDGFEGNAQSFRIVTKLAFRSTSYPGLNLTRATLNAILKYTWLRGRHGKKKHKWGSYKTEKDIFKWAREGLTGDGRSIEAELMDWADDVTYSAHDLEDFYRAGKIPLHQLSNRTAKERSKFFDEVFSRRDGQEGIWQTNRTEMEKAFESVVVGVFEIEEPYNGTKMHRSKLRRFTGFLIDRYINGLRLKSAGQKRVEIDPGKEREVTMLKELTWHYVINDPSMASQQFGQRKIISDLFQIFEKAARTRKNFLIFPKHYQEELESNPSESLRIVIDLIAGMTEKQAVIVHQRLTGTALGSALEYTIQ